MIIDLVAPSFSMIDPIKGLEIKALEKTAQSPYEYKITDKDVISALESATDQTITEAYIVDYGEVEEEWGIIVYFDIPVELLLYKDDDCVFDITRMEGTPADLL